jgi:leucyl/phenylalanyl-tRNA---protein transferase
MLPSPLLVSAYASGWFPMAVDTGEIRWYSPDPRGILPLDAFHVPRRLARAIRSGAFEVDIDRDFADVIRACAARGRHGHDSATWINDEILESYAALHAEGLAHSVEVRKDGMLAGGLYGVALRGAFFGESMFHTVTDASKVALAVLVDRLVTRGFELLDIQWVTPHLSQFGAIEIPRSDYLRRLDRAMRRSCEFV